MYEVGILWKREKYSYGSDTFSNLTHLEPRKWNLLNSNCIGVMKCRLKKLRPSKIVLSIIKWKHDGLKIHWMFSGAKP